MESVSYLDTLNTQARENVLHRINKINPDYWAPAKKSSKLVYKNFIRKNTFLIVFVVFIILLLLYRYRKVKKDRELKALKNYYKNALIDGGYDENQIEFMLNNNPKRVYGEMINFIKEKNLEMKKKNKRY